MVHGKIDQRRANALPPKVGLDKQSIQLGHVIIDDHRGEPGNSIAQLRHEDLATLDLLDWQINGVRFGFQLVVIFAKRQRRAPLKLLQFLVEAVALSLVGGGIGIALGFALAEALQEWVSWPARVPADAVAMAFGFAAATGIFFGFYPAQKAARLDPIDALRFE